MNKSQIDKRIMINDTNFERKLIFESFSFFMLTRKFDHIMIKKGKVIKSVPIKAK